MTTFIFSQALNSINSKKNQVTQIFNSITDSFPKTTWKDDKITGKLSELSIQSSSYNKIIPMIYGTNRIAGNIIWLGEVQEVFNTNTTTIKIGKGQKIKQNTIEYFYYLSFAIGICKSEVEDIKNVWADSTLLDLKKYKYRFYNGTSNQAPDSLLESLNDIGKTPAYRDMCYIVFENFPITEFNNRIPNFLFEVVRKNDYTIDDSTLEFSVNGLNIKPASGYAAINTVLQYRAEEQMRPSYINSGLGSWTVLNQNNSENTADIIQTLNQLDERFVNCEWIVSHVAIFGDNMDIKNCTLKPRVDFNVFHGFPYNDGYPIYTKPVQFVVGSKWNRYNTPLLSKDVNGKFRINGASFGDNDIINFYTELKNRNKRIVFCPEILMDIENTPSSKLLLGNCEDVHNFFVKENGYNEFILHYAELVKDYVDVFLIGNELIGLTSIFDENNNFVAVDELVNLAEKVRNIVGDKVKISYAAGYKEYHSLNGFYHMDKFWSSEYVDFVGINAFFPLTSTYQDSITKNTIKNGWFSGEGYDYIDNKPVEAKWAYKNMEYWWNNKHINNDGTDTSWVERSKKIWFIEYGFRSIDASTNEPYKDIDELPSYSTGESNFYAQRLAIEATEETFENSEYVENKFLYYWDGRPYPYFPNRTDIWEDGNNWAYDYSLNGKSGLSNAKVSISQIFKDAEIDPNLIESINLDEFINGFVINNSLTVKDILYNLQKVYFFDCIEKYDKISFLSKKDYEIITTINHSDLLPIEENKFISIEVLGDGYLPKRVNLIFLDKNRDYDTNSVYAERSSINNNNIYIETVPIILEENRAKTIAETILYSAWLERTTFNFILPMNFLYLECSDVIKLNLDNNQYILKILNIKYENYRIYVKATIFDNTIYNVKTETSLNENLEILQGVGDSNIEIFEIPATNSDNVINVFFAITGELKTWQGANLYSSTNNNEYKFLLSTKVVSGIGTVINNNQTNDVRPYYFDYETKIVVQFNHNIDESMLKSTENIFEGENLAIYGNEVMQFCNIYLNEDGTYTVSKLLRGLFDTENFINNHSEDDKFILINNYLFKEELSYDRIDYEYYYKIESINGFGDKTRVYRVQGKNLKPFRPCFFRYNKLKNILYLEWKEKSRGYTNWLNNRDHISVENYERYYLEFFKNDKVIDSSYVNAREFEYNFDVLPDKVRLCQVNDLYGFGDFVELDIK